MDCACASLKPCFSSNALVVECTSSRDMLIILLMVPSPSAFGPPSAIRTGSLRSGAIPQRPGNAPALLSFVMDWIRYVQYCIHKFQYHLSCLSESGRPGRARPTPHIPLRSVRMILDGVRWNVSVLPRVGAQRAAAFQPANHDFSGTEHMVFHGSFGFERIMTLDGSQNGFVLGDVFSHAPPVHRACRKHDVLGEAYVEIADDLRELHVAARIHDDTMKSVVRFDPRRKCLGSCCGSVLAVGIFRQGIDDRGEPLLRRLHFFDLVVPDPLDGEFACQALKLGSDLVCFSDFPRARCTHDRSLVGYVSYKPLNFQKPERLPHGGAADLEFFGQCFLAKA